jgi:pilus assembly protein Flp/PilA
MKLPMWFHLRKREDGQGLVEYALVLVLIAVVVILILTALGTRVTATFARVIGGLNGQTILGSGTEAIVSGFEVAVSGGPAVCTVAITNITALGFVNGELAGGAALSGSATFNGGSPSAISGTTDSSGVATIGSGGSASGSCTGTVSVTLAGNTRSVNY